MENVKDNVSENEKYPGLGILMPVLIMAFFAAAVWYLMGVSTTSSHEKNTSESTAEIETNINESPTIVLGKVDSLTGNFIYEPGNIVMIDLPNNGGKLEVGKNSTENKLFNFFIDKSAMLDTVKGNWFEFTNVKFKTGGTVIDSSSLDQIKNIAAICRSFTTAQFKVGGYTDNSGDSLKNVTLSQKRAEAVLYEFKKQGVPAASFTGAKGYGPEHPIGDNATAEGRAMNRRVAVNVKAK